jgi:septal ring factor EnvC (AmiA/AmiB activator)
MVVLAQRALRAGALVAGAMGALAILLGVAGAQQNARPISQVERDRTAATQEAERLRAEANAARTEVASLNTRLVEAGARRTEAETALADAEARMAALRLRAASDGARYRRDRDSLEAAVMTAAFAQRRLGPNSSRAGVFARAAAPTFASRVRAGANALEEAQRLDAAIAEEQEILTAAQAAIDAERADVITLLSQRRALQASLASDAAAAERRARRFAAEARNLRELAQRVQAARPRNRAAAAATGGATLPTAWLAPAQGRVSRGFGEVVGGAPATQGVTLTTRASAQVVSPASGEVAYAGLFRSYGQVLILNLDGGYALVLTGMETVRARVGEAVLAGQPVGEMSASDTPAPELYVEVRRQGRPINPARWLSARSQDVALR